MQELRVLNRVLRWTAEGVTYEADPRHAEILLAGLLGTSRPATTPGAAAAKGGLEEEEGEAEDDVPLKGDEVGLFRSYAARANYLAMDRPARVPREGALPAHERAGARRPPGPAAHCAVPGEHTPVGVQVRLAG